MKRIAPVMAWLSIGLWLSGCASYHVQRGAAYGALGGAALGAGLGELVGDPNLLGSEAQKPDKGGDTSFSHGSTVLVGLGIGAVVGAIVGAMWGHRRDDGFEGKPPPPPPPTASSDDSGSAAAARLPAYLTNL